MFQKMAGFAYCNRNLCVQIDWKDSDQWIFEIVGKNEMASVVVNGSVHL